ncbi:MAG: hypothetical protein CVT63_07965 [Candidatus Anoxymicrobium japonicum]|uniref:Uncharacterized protein n=1 Tax=Candidatus Anoxymicrobium japonicum TaxID=2013648 RepID=A0A2N3G3Y2_9ACTN|nr:MAG: hypothetical protein CVT63_07965 [Candidatus Anoxymicrobium japonicum]
MFTSVYSKKPEYAATKPDIQAKGHVRAPSIPGNIRINLTKDHAGRASSADRLARIDGAIPEYTANVPSTSR